jgi:hypothetical protein
MHPPHSFLGTISRFSRLQDVQPRRRSRIYSTFITENQNRMNVSFSEVTILLSQTVFSLLVANHITKTSEAVPLLGRLNISQNQTVNEPQTAKRTLSWCNHRWLEFLSIFSLAATRAMSTQGNFLCLACHTTKIWMMKSDTFYSFTYQLNTLFGRRKEKLSNFFSFLQTVTHSVTHFAHAVTSLKLIYQKPIKASRFMAT